MLFITVCSNIYYLPFRRLQHCNRCVFKGSCSSISFYGIPMYLCSWIVRLLLHGNIMPNWLFAEANQIKEGTIRTTIRASLYLCSWIIWLLFHGSIMPNCCVWWSQPDRGNYMDTYPYILLFWFLVPIFLCMCPTYCTGICISFASQSILQQLSLQGIW